MTGTQGEVVFTRDLTSGTVHKRIRDGARLLVDERCNLDQAGAYEVIVSLDTSEDLCEHCFGAAEPDEAA